MISKSRLGFVLAIVVVFFEGIFLGNFNKQNLPILWPSNNEDMSMLRLMNGIAKDFLTLVALKRYL